MNFNCITFLTEIITLSKLYSQKDQKYGKNVYNDMKLYGIHIHFNGERF